MTIPAAIDLQSLLLAVPNMARVVRRHFASDYTEFVDLLNDDLDAILSELQSNPQLRNEDKEDRITIEIVGNLKQLAYDATHDAMHAGHADIVVRKENFVWLAEAKIHTGYDKLMDGLDQLVHRYSMGTQNNDRGALLIYSKNKNTSDVMAKWKEHLRVHTDTPKNYPNLIFDKCPKNNLAFLTECTHPKSGSPYTTRHVPLSLFHKPVK